MQIILSSRNPSKAVEIRAIFQDLPITILTLKEVEITGEAVENGTTLQENAFLKAMFAHPPGSDSWSMSDDTGLFIDALGGRPGIHSARWAGDNATTEEITAHTLRELEGVEDRRATFRTVAVLLSPWGKPYFFEGELRGKILETPRCPARPKMPYSPIFLPEGHELVLAEMSIEEENRISHRGQAFRQVRDFLLSRRK